MYQSVLDISPQSKELRDLVNIPGFNYTEAKFIDKPLDMHETLKVNVDGKLNDKVISDKLYMKLLANVTLNEDLSKSKSKRSKKRDTKKVIKKSYSKKEQSKRETKKVK